MASIISLPCAIAATRLQSRPVERTPYVIPHGSSGPLARTSRFDLSTSRWSMCLWSTSGIGREPARSPKVYVDGCVHSMNVVLPARRPAFRWWLCDSVVLSALSGSVQGAQGAVHVFDGVPLTFENGTLVRDESGPRSPHSVLGPTLEPGGLPSLSGIVVFSPPTSVAGRRWPSPGLPSDSPAASATPGEAVVAVAAMLVVLALGRARRRPRVGR